MKGLGEVPFEDPRGDGRGEGRIGGEGRLDVEREFGPYVVCPKFADAGDVVAGLEGQPSWGVDGPDAVALESPEGLLGVVRLPGRPELAQQGGQVGLGLAEGDFLLASLPPPEGVEDEKRLVRGALVALLPDAEVVELSQDRVFRHLYPRATKLTDQRGSRHRLRRERFRTSQWGDESTFSCLLLLALWPLPALASDFAAKVVGVPDGDTLIALTAVMLHCPRCRVPERGGNVASYRAGHAS